jgi:hypothetical protein
MAKASTLKASTADADTLAAQAQAQAEATLVADIKAAIETYIAVKGTRLPDALAVLAGDGMPRARANAILTRIGYVKGGFEETINEAQATDALLALTLGTERWDASKAEAKKLGKLATVKDSPAKLTRGIAALVADGAEPTDAALVVTKETRTKRQIMLRHIAKGTDGYKAGSEMLDLTDSPEIANALAILAEADWENIPLAENAPVEDDAGDDDATE